MKCVVVYSGKGGVGKTTVTSLLAVYLLRRGYRITLLDADLNTPSLPVIFPDHDLKNKYPNLTVHSIGYNHKNGVMTSTSSSQYLKDIGRKISTENPDYLIIDTPPSITNIHESLFSIFNVSGTIIVSQLTSLSQVDVNRTLNYLHDKNVPITGIVYNMVRNDSTPTKKSVSLPVIAEIPFSDSVTENQLHSAKIESIEKIADVVENLDHVTLEFSKRMMLSDFTTVKTLKKMVREGNDIPLKFINLDTWDWIKEYNDDDENKWHGIQRDKFLDENTTERIERLLRAFEYGDTALFMVTNAPNTEIPLFPGEIGTARLCIRNDAYYGVPCIKYSTTQGEVTLFSHEVIPITSEDYLTYQNEEDYRLVRGNRLLPNKETLSEIEATFGSRIGLKKDWETTYDALMN